MHVASAKIGVATAAMFPSFNLSGTLGTQGTSLDKLTAASGRFWSVGPSVTAPVFQGTTLWYGRRAAIDVYQQSAASYRTTVLSAFAQVADSITALQHDAERLQAQVEAENAARDSLQLIDVNYRAGLVSDVNVLVADILYHQAIILYLQTVAQRHQDTVALFVALGGGWWNGVKTLKGRPTP